MDSRTNDRIRREGGKLMRMDLLILHTIGRHGGEPGRTPVSSFANGDDTWLIVASDGGSRDPDWYLNPMAHPDRASIEFSESDSVPVTRPDGADRQEAWGRIRIAQPRYARHQGNSDREYPVVRLTRS